MSHTLFLSHAKSFKVMVLQPALLKVLLLVKRILLSTLIATPMFLEADFKSSLTIANVIFQKMNVQNCTSQNLPKF